MNKDNLNTLFEDLENEFDIEAPNIGHQQRFLNKLNNQNKIATTDVPKRIFWKPLISIAASIVLLVALFFGTQQEVMAKDLGSVSPEMAETENFFTSTISSELAKLNGETSPETVSLIQDALKQLETLEIEYAFLKQDLAESGDDQRVIFAMISNFQNRIELLQNVLQKIEEIKQLKQ
ncbi:MAG: hypothetical protein HKO81_00255 [Flavobacteriaceae bacterium]|nr:hypothetical protein [Flavobacteriaceae bacterium]